MLLIALSKDISLYFFTISSGKFSFIIIFLSISFISLTKILFVNPFFKVYIGKISLLLASLQGINGLITSRVLLTFLNLPIRLYSLPKMKFLFI